MSWTTVYLFKSFEHRLAKFTALYPGPKALNPSRGEAYCVLFWLNRECYVYSRVLTLGKQRVSMNYGMVPASTNVHVMRNVRMLLQLYPNLGITYADVEIFNPFLSLKIFHKKQGSGSFSFFFAVKSSFRPSRSHWVIISETLSHGEQLTLLLLAPDPITKRGFHCVNLCETYFHVFSVFSPPLLAFPRFSPPISRLHSLSLRWKNFSILFFVNAWGGIHISAGYADT